MSLGLVRFSKNELLGIMKEIVISVIEISYSIFLITLEQLKDG